MPVHDDRLLFEYLTLEGAQAGLSWATILRKRPYYRQAFAGFDPAAVARFTAKREAKLLADPGIVRNRLKVASTISNAKAVLAVQDEVGSLDAYLWQFVGGEPRVNRWRSMREVPARTAESDAMSKALRKRGFRFVGSTICYAFMQAVGMVNDHTIDCFRHPSHAREPRRPARPHRLAAADPADLRARRRRPRRRAGGGARPARRPARVRRGDRAGRLRRHGSRTCSSARGVGVTRFNDFSENPDGDQCAAGAAGGQGRRHRGIVALGGGSSLDCAKGANFLHADGGEIADFRGYGKVRGTMLPMIGIPTTAGTGSDAQSYAVLSDARTHVKMACGDPGAAFKIALLDPALTVSQPASVTAAPATTRCRTPIESFVTTARTPLSQTFAREAWRLVRGQLAPRAAASPDDLDARGAMLLGSHLAGLAIEHSMLGAGPRLRQPADRAVRRHARDRGVADAAARRALERGGRPGRSTPTCWTGPGRPIRSPASGWPASWSRSRRPAASR